MGERIKVFVSNHCGPCQKVKELIEQGAFNAEEVELIDLETDEGFPYIKKLGLSKTPSAYIGTKQCRLSFDKNEPFLIIDCPGSSKGEGQDGA
jgi:glutaredoxin